MTIASTRLPHYRVRYRNCDRCCIFALWFELISHPKLRAIPVVFLPYKSKASFLSPFYRPLDLCDIAASDQDAMPLGFQSPHTGGLSLPNQGASPSMHPSGLSSSIQGHPGSPSLSIGNNLASQSSQFTNSR